MMVRLHCQWNSSSSTMTNWLFQEFCVNVRPPVGPIGTPHGNMIWGIRHLIQEYHGKSFIWYWPGELLIYHRVGPS
jgi:hypothetical protein